MADGPVLAQLHFGREDAERDVTEGLLLRGGFLPNAAYRGALSGRKMLIIGRKGSGKSAICMQLMAADGARAHNGGQILVTPDEAAGEEIRRFELQGLPGDSAKALIWRYVFAVHAARHIVTHAKGTHGGGHKLDSVKALGRFLKQNGESVDGGQGSGGGWLGERLARGARGLQTSLSLEAFGVKASVDLAQSPSEGARAAQQLGIVEQGVAGAFADLGCDGNVHPPLLLMVDQLEQVWSAEPDSNSMVIGLLLAAKHATSRYGRSVRFLLFLRADIYDSLSFGEGDKFHGDELRIGWTEKALRDLALARARASAGAALSEEYLWKVLFPETVGGEDTATYLFRRCLPRPRDAIQFLNACQETAWLENGRDRITEADVEQAGRQFSAWKLKDLSSEYLVAHPFLKNLFPLFQNTGYVVTRAALAGRFETAAESFRNDFPAYAHALTLSGVIDVLYGVGFLGVRRGSGVVFAGADDSPVQPHETEFHIHACFRAALGATSPFDLRPYEPLLAHARIVSGNFNPETPGFTARNRDDRLLQQLGRSCHSILAQVGRAVTLTPDVGDEIRRQINRVLDDVNRIPPGAASSMDVNVDEYLLGAAHYFGALAAQLLAGGLDDTTGVGAVAHRMEDEARGLRRAAGGSFGSSGNSSGR
ncbi:P-loop ATPase, Sll1717 family [Streptomyces sp. NPDC060209]|uniref:P-loop ATPase, Sll1717 family n=1 Tax=Streptomyces sp. NPDC060209 TaxID=3347073 RepID=UPI00364C810C